MQHFECPGPAGTLEGCVTHAESPQQPWALICHPHPLYQGSMHNKVVSTSAKTCQKNGINSVRFNFRGVGASESDYVNLEGACADARAVIHWMTQHHTAPQWLIGFSFGSYVAACMATSGTHLILIAPPVMRLPFDTLNLPQHTTVIQGELDSIATSEATTAWVTAHTDQPIQYMPIPEATHFFDQKLLALSQAITMILSSNRSNSQN